MRYEVAMGDWFRKFAHVTAGVVGTPAAFTIAMLSVVVWLFSGHFFNYSDTWQLIINTATTIVTFLMVFLIQNSQNRDSRATQLKLDELIRAQRGARNSLIDLEDLTDEELEKVHRDLVALKDHAERNLSQIHKTQRINK